jgi:ribonuclease D
MSKLNFYSHDIPDSEMEKLLKVNTLAFDVESMGLNLQYARLCLIQLYFPEIDCTYMVHFPANNHISINKMYQLSVNLKKLLRVKKIKKIAHYARFDCLAIKKYLGVTLENVVCTKIMSQVCRTYSDKHGLKDLLRELFNINIDKTNQTSDWGSSQLSDSQKSYAMNDVIHLPGLYAKLMEMCIREKKLEIVNEMFKCIIPFVNVENLGFNPSKILDPFGFK